jgi:hypothetical protein
VGLGVIAPRPGGRSAFRLGSLGVAPATLSLTRRKGMFAKSFSEGNAHLGFLSIFADVVTKM